MPPEEHEFKFDDISQFCGYVKRAIEGMDKDIKEVKGMMIGFQENVGTLKIKVAGIGAIVSLLTSILFVVVKTLIAK